MTASRPSPLLRILVLAAIWGTSFLFIKVGLEGMSPVEVVVGRLLAGTAVLLAVVVVRREQLPRDLVTWGHLAVAGLIANTAPFFLFAWGEERASSSLAGIYNASTPLLTLLVAMAALPEERPDRARLAGLGVGFAGVLVVLAPWRGVGASSLDGQLAYLGAAACYGVAFVYMRRYLSGRGHSPLVLSCGQLACAAVESLLILPGYGAAALGLTPRVVLSVLALGAVGTGLAYLINYSLIRDVGATTTSTVTYLIPVVAVALGVLVLGESLGWNDPAGAVIVVAGVAVAERRLHLRPAATPAPCQE